MDLTAEEIRLREARTGVPWRFLGPYLSERQWGTVREDYSLDGDALVVLQPRPGPLARLPLGRGRAGRDQRRAPADVPGAGAVERAGPDPQGAPLRADQPRGQPRRGRQGVLLLRRQPADPLLPALAVQVPAGRLPLRRPGGDERRALAPRDGVRAARHRRVRRGPLLRRRGHLRQGRGGRPGLPDRRHQPWTRRRPDPSPADAVVPQHVDVPPAHANARRCAASTAPRPPCGPTTTSSARGTSTPAMARRCCSATTSRTPPGCGRPPTHRRSRRTASPITCSTARRP